MVLPTNSASYANASAHDLASNVTNNYGQINEILARYANANSHDLASYVTNNYSQFHEISSRYSMLILMIRLPMLPITVAESMKN